jgi:galactose mutarotase-like enzyme
MERSDIKLKLDNLSLVILPEFGGRISSIKLDGREEWISQPLAPLVARNVGDDFIRPEISGWDEMVPTTDCCQSLDGLHDLPDHGEVWSRPWSVEEVRATSLTLSIELVTRTLRFWRKVSLVATDPNQSSVIIQYRITNTGKISAPAYWSSHPLFSAADITQVQISPAVHLEQTTPQTPQIEQTFLPQNLQYGTSVEYWCQPDEAVESVTLLRSSGEFLTLSWNKAEVPYFGIFVDNKEYAREIVISPQPAIAYRVSERSAEAAHRVPILAPGESTKWSLQVALKR